MKSPTFRRTWALLAGAMIFAVGQSAFAQEAGADECQVDTDCPGDKACGGPVCSWTAGPNHKCVPAGTGLRKQDGWCNGMNSDCKCASLGA